ncbi:MAG: hypothetical protein ABIH50_06180 [bacterium]
MFRDLSIINNYFIPKNLIPEVSARINAFTRTSPLKLAVREIHFDLLFESNYRL